MPKSRKASPLSTSLWSQSVCVMARRAQQPVTVALLLALAACAGTARRSPQAGGSAGVRISMAELHGSGGVPHGWQFRLPPGDPKAGRQTFVDLGCFTCHTVRDESFPEAARGATDVGPDLSAMGSHHPASYFAESIVNPNAVLVDGPGYIGPDGRSIMPAYPDMTLQQLGDLVAYLRSLTGGDGDSRRRLAGSAGGATEFLVQAYDVDPDAVDELYDWFDHQQFRAYDGLVSIDTYLGRHDRQLTVVAIFGFDNEVSLGRFVQQLAAPPNGASPQFVRPAHVLFRSPAVYKAIGLLLP